jgi:hypothetical protein
MMAAKYRCRVLLCITELYSIVAFLPIFGAKLSSVISTGKFRELNTKQMNGYGGIGSKASLYSAYAMTPAPTRRQ